MIQERVPITLELYRLLPAYLTQEQHCLHCGTRFKECENVGRHLCRVHPGIRLAYPNRASHEAFYSCCGRAVSATTRTEGCLEWDHYAQKLSETDANLRLAQIQEVATMVVPHLLMRFITPPLQCALLYDSEIGGTTFRHQFGALQTVIARHDELLRIYKPQITHWHIDQQQQQPPIQPEDLGSIQFDLVAESRQLWREGKQSPFFSKFFNKATTQSQSIQSKCDAIWRSQLSMANPTEDGEDEGQVEEVPFVIIARIHSHLQKK